MDSFNFHNSYSLASIIMHIALFELITISITSKKVNGIIHNGVSHLDKTMVRTGSVSYRGGAWDPPPSARVSPSPEV